MLKRRAVFLLTSDSNGDAFSQKKLFTKRKRNPALAREFRGQKVKSQVCQNKKTRPGFGNPAASQISVRFTVIGLRTGGPLGCDNCRGGGSRPTYIVGCIPRSLASFESGQASRPAVPRARRGQRSRAWSEGVRRLASERLRYGPIYAGISRNPTFFGAKPARASAVGIRGQPGGARSVRSHGPTGAGRAAGWTHPERGVSLGCCTGGGVTGGGGRKKRQLVRGPVGGAGRRCDDRRAGGALFWTELPWGIQTPPFFLRKRFGGGRPAWSIGFVIERGGAGRRCQKVQPRQSYGKGKLATVCMFLLTPIFTAYKQTAFPAAKAIGWGPWTLPRGGQRVSGEFVRK